MERAPEFPIILGVTGHLDIHPAALSKVQNSVETLLVKWKKAFGPALHLMTGLADGADLYQLT